MNWSRVAADFKKQADEGYKVAEKDERVLNDPQLRSAVLLISRIFEGMAEAINKGLEPPDAL